RGIGPLLEALDVLSVLRCEGDAPRDLREKSLHLAARILEMTGAVANTGGYGAAQRALDSGAAHEKFGKIVFAQGAREIPPPARFRKVVLEQHSGGRVQEVDCWEIARVAKRAGAPANVSAGVKMLKSVGEQVTSGEPLFEIHAASAAQLESASSYARSVRRLIRYEA
ncbi:MAG TPA: hypothetical protein VIX12_04395, partial [Candidatus Binataceae bacterium]